MNSLVFHTGSCLILWEFMINVYTTCTYLLCMCGITCACTCMYTRKSLVCVTCICMMTKSKIKGIPASVYYVDAIVTTSCLGIAGYTIEEAIQFPHTLPVCLTH